MLFVILIMRPLHGSDFFWQNLQVLFPVLIFSLATTGQGLMLPDGLAV